VIRGSQPQNALLVLPLHWSMHSRRRAVGNPDWQGACFICSPAR
jgi:hypothetical protein